MIAFFTKIGLGLLPIGKSIGRVLGKSAAETHGWEAAKQDTIKKSNKIAEGARKISEEAREINRNANYVIAQSANVIRVSGPGKANCPGPVATGTSGQTSNGKTDAPVASVLNQERVELIGLPFPATVNFAEQHDRCQIDRRTWESWYEKLVAEWGK
jgi:hypothetical protein